MQVKDIPLRHLRQGDKLLLEAGSGDHRVKAKVYVTETPDRGATGANVCIEDIIDRGDEASDGYKAGATVIAGQRELSALGEGPEFLAQLVARMLEQ